jgi:pantoate--beta-alanine ligase
MQVLRGIAQMREAARRERVAGSTIGLVPTMGYLHDGHLSLVRCCRPRCGVMVVSIYVNPTQFGPSEDFASYPRDLERDLSLCEGEGVDIVFVPDSGEMYLPAHSTFVSEEALSLPLCGVSRPAHFRGVTTVVAKLFNIVRPDMAVFGQKDAQQVRVIRRMARDLNMGVEIVAAPTVRETDGLAMSSRNVYLDPAQRQRARCINEALKEAHVLFVGGERSVPTLLDAMRRVLEPGNPPVQIDYLDIRDDETLEPVDTIAAPVLVALAVRIGKTRLIDNTVLDPAAPRPAGW